MLEHEETTATHVDAVRQFIRRSLLDVHRAAPTEVDVVEDRERGAVRTDWIELQRQDVTETVGADWIASSSSQLATERLRHLQRSYKTGISPLISKAHYSESPLRPPSEWGVLGQSPMIRVSG